MNKFQIYRTAAQVWAVAFCLVVFAASAQAQAPQLLGPSERGAISSDTILPFAIAKEKRLPDEELAEKKEGAYLTGLPEISSDPLNGFGLGAELELYFNGRRRDPFFAYTPYRHKLAITALATTKAQREMIIHWDAPYFAGSRWRLRGEVGYERNPNLVYYGLRAANTLRPLSLPTPEGLPGREYSSYRAYEKALPEDAVHYDDYDKEEYIINLSAERNYLEGRLRVLVGYEVAYVNIRTFGGRSRLREDRLRDPAAITGLGANWITITQAGVIYDTRNFEPDPSAGTLAEVTEEISLPALGSAFTFFKTFGQVKQYQRLWGGPRRAVLAGRLGLGHTEGRAPFYEYQDQWSSEGSMEGLGGTSTLRGYKQSRFLGRYMAITNLELRQRLGSVKVLRQGFSLDAVPFADAGTVADMAGELTRAANWRTSAGLGLRIGWNLSTIVRLDYAVSKEDRQFFLSLGHSF